jgi:dihydroxyacetone kinase-like protein
MEYKSNDVVNILNKISEKICQNKDYLTELDAATGDADHGVNMEKGFKALSEKIKAFKDNSIQDILKNTGMVLMSTVGGASGALYGTAFIKAAKAVHKNEVVNKEIFLNMFQAALDGIKMRGKSHAGEKTMVDTLEPAVEGLRSKIEEGACTKDTFEAFKEAAQKGMKATKDMIATKGRAHYQGENSRGHLDPGAVSVYYMIEIITEYVLNER